jgi:ElaB/YqjD/DUF883 family membrane-anchored ribosome-binding protein
MQIPSNKPLAGTNGPGANPAISAGEATPSRVSAEFHNFVEDVEDLVTQTTSVTGADLVRVKAKLSARVAAAKESIQEMSTQVAQSARKAATATDTYVHEQPWQAVGIGAAVGVLLGFVLGRRK